MNMKMRYEITTYRGEGDEIEVRSITAEERRELDLTHYDHLLDSSRGEYAYRNAAGEWVSRPLDGSGLGKITLDVIKAMQCNPGEYLGPKDLAELTGNDALYGSDAVAARIKVIRQAHQEKPGAPRFFFTRKNGGYGLMWPIERSWIWIDRIIENS